jgi:hypothetical protein
MEASVAPWPSVRSALSQLIDYAGLFPPAKLAIADAWAEYNAARATPYSWILGRFIIPARLLLEMSERPEGAFSVIAGAPELDGVATLRAQGVAVEALEIPPAEGITAVEAVAKDVAAAGLADQPVYVEISRAHSDLPGAMHTLSRARLGAKLRCGGLTADAFPSVREVAAFIAAATAAGVPYKATAGLHHPVRHTDAATGFQMHGFLNLLSAAAIAPRADRALLERIVAEEDAAAFRFEESALRWRDERIETRELAHAREAAFIAYGSCSFSEPIDDLTGLGILGAP